MVGVSILSGVEDVQQMLDDHILKAQTMHSSAYIKPFEEEMKDWEDKLISMQVFKFDLAHNPKVIPRTHKFKRFCNYMVSQIKKGPQHSKNIDKQPE